MIYRNAKGEVAMDPRNAAPVKVRRPQTTPPVKVFPKVRNEVGKGNKIFDRGARAALNMSTTLGTDLTGATKIVGRASPAL